MILTFLQNAWFHRPLHGWHKQKGVAVPLPEWSSEWRLGWLWATGRCRSGNRLRKLLGEDCFEREDMAFSNASPKVSYGDSAGKFPADPKWIASELDLHKPDVVVCCGTVAGQAVPPLWSGPMVVVPHPASRLVTDKLYIEAVRTLLAPDFGRRLCFVQERGRHAYFTIDG
jgi:hypothetical protein